MVVNKHLPGPAADDDPDGGQLEWRRWYYDVSDGGQLALGIVLALSSTAPLTAALLADHRSMSIFWGGLALLAAGGSVMLLTLAGAFSHRPNTATFDDHAFRIGTTIGRHPIFGAIIATLGTAVSLIGVIAAGRAGQAVVDPGRRIPLMVALLFIVVLLIVAVAGNPFDRRLEFSPEGLSFQLGHQAGHIPWAAITDMRTHWTNPLRGMPGTRIRDGILFRLSDGAHVQGKVLRPGANFRLPTVGFDVDEDTLYNVIAALRAHPELRELAGREEGGVLFTGPRRSLRKRLRRTEVWLPWERNIHAALAGSRARSGDDDLRDVPDDI